MWFNNLVKMINEGLKFAKYFFGYRRRLTVLHRDKSCQMKVVSSLQVMSTITRKS